MPVVPAVWLRPRPGVGRGAAHTSCSRDRSPAPQGRRVLVLERHGVGTDTGRSGTGPRSDGTAEADVGKGVKGCGRCIRRESGIGGCVLCDRAGGGASKEQRERTAGGSAADRHGLDARRALYGSDPAQFWQGPPGWGVELGERGSTAATAARPRMQSLGMCQLSFVSGQWSVVGCVRLTTG